MQKLYLLHLQAVLSICRRKICISGLLKCFYRDMLLTFSMIIRTVNENGYLTWLCSQGSTKQCTGTLSVFCYYDWVMCIHRWLLNLRALLQDR